VLVVVAATVGLAVLLIFTDESVPWQSVDECVPVGREVGLFWLRVGAEGCGVAEGVSRGCVSGDRSDGLVVVPRVIFYHMKSAVPFFDLIFILVLSVDMILERKVILLALSFLILPRVVFHFRQERFIVECFGIVQDDSVRNVDLCGPAVVFDCLVAIHEAGLSLQEDLEIFREAVETFAVDQGDQLHEH
jgi:hypothetical protein